MSETWATKSGKLDESGGLIKKEETISNRSKEKTPSPPPTIPKVGLTDSLRATCLVNVGDRLPQAQLIAADGSNVSMQTQYGEKLTVLFFWSKGGSNYAQLIANSALQDLQLDVAEPYSPKGVKVIGVFVGAKPQTAGQEFEKSGTKFPRYFDPNGVFFSKVATDKLPRIYLCDASGKIVWFDTEYSRGTRRNLMQAIQVALGQK